MSTPDIAERFFSFEGLDGCGKSTQIQYLARFLTSKGYSITHIREPGGCPISEQIRQTLLYKKNANMSTMSEFLLYWAARAQLVHEIITPALKNGNIVLADRFGWSTFAYQGYGRGMDLASIHYLRNLACGKIWPSFTVLLDIPPAVMRKRINAENKNPDRMESQNNDFFTRTREGYLTLTRENPESFTVVDGNLDISIIEEKIRTAILKRLQK
jgi:dTMP kinase